MKSWNAKPHPMTELIMSIMSRVFGWENSVASVSSVMDLEDETKVSD